MSIIIGGEEYEAKPDCKKCDGTGLMKVRQTDRPPFEVTIPCFCLKRKKK